MTNVTRKHHYFVVPKVRVHAGQPLPRIPPIFSLLLDVRNVFLRGILMAILYGKSVPSASASA